LAGNEEGRPIGEFKPGRRPHGIVYFRDSQNIKITDLTIQNSVRHTMVIELCDPLHINNIVIRNPPSDIGVNTDAIDLNTTSNVLIENCDIETGDDAICIKPQRDYFRSMAKNPPMAARKQFNIHVRDCVLATTCNAVKIGTGSYVDLDNMLIENITVNKHSGRSIPDEGSNDTTARSATSGISVQTNDGGNITNLVYRNFVINDVDTPIFIGQQQRYRANAKAPDYTHEIGIIDGVVIENVTVTNSYRANQINSQDETIIRNITFKDIDITNHEDYKGLTRPPRMTGHYPDGDRFGRMPAYGLFARNVDGLHFQGEIKFTDAVYKGEERPEIALENIVNITGLAEERIPEQIDTTDYPRFPNLKPAFVETFDEGMDDRMGTTNRWKPDRNFETADTNGSWSYRRGPVGTWQYYRVPDRIPGSEILENRTVIEKGETPSNRYLVLDYPGASEWENYHIHMKVWPGRREHRVPANTQIRYRFSTDRNEGVNVAFTRSNRGYIRMNQYDPFINKDGQRDSNGVIVYQIGLAELANPIMDNDMKFFALDIVVDGPFISVYVDDVDMVRDFYDATYEDPARRKGTICIGGSPLGRWGDIRVTPIEKSSLAATSANYSRSGGANLDVGINFNGNAVTYIRNAGTTARLVRDTDFTVTDSGVTLNRSFLQTLPAGRTELTINFNLGVRELPFTLNVQ
jgi:hypothetical protein